MCKLQEDRPQKTMVRPTAFPVLPASIEKVWGRFVSQWDRPSFFVVCLLPPQTPHVPHLPYLSPSQRATIETCLDCGRVSTRSGRHFGSTLPDSGSAWMPCAAWSSHFS